MKENISEKAAKIIEQLPRGVSLEAACKNRKAEEIQEAVDAGVKILGQNYIQQARDTYDNVRGDISWHFIGHLQRNKVKYAVKIFDMIESLDSIRLARELNKRCAKEERTINCLVEINSAKEENKYGILPENTVEFVKEAARFENIKIKGLMTMGALSGTPEEFRPYFRTVKNLFYKLREMSIEGVEMKVLSMGMSASYKTAIEEGANLVRIGTSIFGPRQERQE